MDAQSIPEIVLSHIWQDRLFHSEMRSTDGQRIEVVYGGVWTHADGPDFRDALIVVAGRLQRGAVELHVHASDWIQHRHSTNPRYDDVILHVVLDDDVGEPVAGSPHSPIPTVVLADYLSVPLADVREWQPVQPLGSLGTRPCLPTLAGGRIDLIHDALRRAGWQRLTEKQMRFAQELEYLPPAEALYRGLLDALGYTRNREGMAALAARLPLMTVEAASRADPRAALALLLGVGGFLPLSPSYGEMIGLDREDIERLERTFQSLASAWSVEPDLSQSWVLNRVRPQNHPARRLASLGALIAAAQPAGLLETFLGLPLDGGVSWRSWLGSVTPAIGRTRCDQITTNILAPFLAAYADATGDHELAEKVGALWESLPGGAEDTIARSALQQITGGARLTIKSAIESQGLHQIGRHGCATLRCFDCPIAALAVVHEPDHRLIGDPTDGAV